MESTATLRLYDKEENMKSILKGLVVAFAALTLVGLTVPKAEAATELGTFCWQYQHASFDDGATHTLRLQVTQHDWVYSLHGHDDPWPTPVDGSAYYFSPVGRTGPTIYMGVYATYVWRTFVQSLGTAESGNSLYS